MRPADFDTLAEALDYAAQGDHGFHFYDSRGRLTATLPYRELRTRARVLARGLLAAGLSRGDRVAAIAESEPGFPELFFACQYAGLIPVALPISLNLGGHAAYVEQLRGLLLAGRPRVALASDDLLPFLREAAEGLTWVSTGTVADFSVDSGQKAALRPTEPEEAAYIQFTSGSTRFPRGVVISEAAAMSNLRRIVRDGLDVQPGDRSVSWLPFYHDMGLVGFMLGPLVTQIPADYLRPQDFARRPVQWLKLISRNRGTIAFGPPIGYQICEQRLRDGDIEQLDLSCWKIAGVGAEMIRLDTLRSFAERVRPAGFDPKAFLPCYGLAESTLAVAFSRLGAGALAERIDMDAMATASVALPAGPDTERVSEVVNCGRPLPGHDVVIRDDEGVELGYRQIGRVTVRGPSVMSEYFEDAELTREVLNEDGWLETGDLGYMTEEGLFITGRYKDLIIVNGRNIWPQDLEALAEEQPQVRTGDVSAFGVVDPEGLEKVVLVVQSRTSDPQEKQQLAFEIQGAVYANFGVHCLVDLVPPHTLPKTSSGKLSRDAARRGFLERISWEDLHAVPGSTGTA